MKSKIKIIETETHYYCKSSSYCVLKPEPLASALQDRISETSGKLISSKPLKIVKGSNGNVGSTDK